MEEVKRSVERLASGKSVIPSNVRWRLTKLAKGRLEDLELVDVGFDNVDNGW